MGSSSVKASLESMDGQNVKLYQAFFPEASSIIAVKAGWARTDPQMWWTNFKLALQKCMAETGAKGGENIVAIGISYQMHGLARR